MAQKTSRRILHEYIDDMHRLLDEINLAAVEEIAGKLDAARKQGRTIFVAGNGGSAATASHFVCDLAKNTFTGEGEKRFRVVSISDCVPWITALANDEGVDASFYGQLRNLMQPKDLFIVFSASGNSPNIVKAIEYSKKQDGEIIGFSGFCGGLLRSEADCGMHVASATYERSEDIHLIIAHLLICWFKNYTSEIENT